MKTIFFFCIPAHGHTNPMLPVAKELVQRGNMVRFYSFCEFREKIEQTGAEFVSCDSYLLQLDEHAEQKLKEVSTTEMTVQAIAITRNMDGFLDGEFKTYQPDVIYTDSVCFWGKLNALKHKVPMVVSTSTFAFNQLSSQYMKHSKKELADMIFGLSRVAKELKSLEPYGYHVKNPLSLVQSDNHTDSVVYTSRRFQPYAESFSAHYAFVGPSVFSKLAADKTKNRPLVYISLGTVINDRPDFYRTCISALGNQNLDVVISCGNAITRESLGEIPDNFQVFASVNQLDVLSKADVFLSHCGMNSVSESLYMGTPLVLYPQTAEQKAVARRVTEIGAGKMLSDDSAEGIRLTVLELLENPVYQEGAESCGKDFRNCSGPSGAAEFIETAPHTTEGTDILETLNQFGKYFQLIYWMLVIVIINLIGFFVGWDFIWVIGILAGFFSAPIGRLMQSVKYQSLIKRK